MQQNQQPRIWVALVCYAAPSKCQQCGGGLPAAMEKVPVPNGAADVEYLADQVVVHGSEGPAVFDRARVAFVKFREEVAGERRSR